MILEVVGGVMAAHGIVVLLGAQVNPGLLIICAAMALLAIGEEVTRRKKGGDA